MCVVTLLTPIITLKPSDTYLRQWTGSPFVQAMGCRLCGDNPWLEWMMAYCQLDPPNRALMETKSKCEYFHSWKCCIKTWRLQNAGNFIPTFHSHETAISIYPGNLLLHAVAIKSPVRWDVPKVERSENRNQNWGSKWNLHTVCWSAVGCEWGTTSVYFGIAYVCFIPSRLPVFVVELQCLLQDFFILSKVSFEGPIQNLQKKFMLV